MDNVVGKILNRPNDLINIFTLMKWLFLIGLILSAPITFNQFIEVKWTELPWFAIWRMGYVVIGTTFLKYFFNIKHNNPFYLCHSIYIRW
mgnify:CR=1 FL=1